jgi:hypothetical protein
MPVSTVTLMPTTVHGVPSGNYDGSSQDFTGNPQKAANYYRGRGGMQTVLYRVTNFVGAITIEATLDDDPATARWFPTNIYGDGSTGTPVNDVHPANIQGNFTWLRAKVTAFSTGTIDIVTATY